MASGRNGRRPLARRFDQQDPPPGRRRSAPLVVVISADAADHKGRNVIERGFNVVKQWRGLATCHDKLASVYRAAAVLRAHW
jgi:hypothetical protein